MRLPLARPAHRSIFRTLLMTRCATCGNSPSRRYHVAKTEVLLPQQSATRHAAVGMTWDQAAHRTPPPTSRCGPPRCASSTTATPSATRRWPSSPAWAAPRRPRTPTSRTRTRTARRRPSWRRQRCTRCAHWGAGRLSGMPGRLCRAPRRLLPKSRPCSTMLPSVLISTALVVYAQLNFSHPVRPSLVRGFLTANPPAPTSHRPPAAAPPSRPCRWRGSPSCSRCWTPRASSCCTPAAACGCGRGWRRARTRGRRCRCGNPTP